ncbi:sugar phosphate isomerase/epimerase family protein [Ktedonospora formicarum]|uniref:Xylose isomerase-like TIM barrel domain-containing protein n=1 Tax=Ktedonospora formicarum TaxID=2778364 RepID=A0A8J3MUH8_9CHLR|nr:sugar phosphate isomerase/epimerase [Ktedonospora formicarum]GHO46931.1 hypothetical protein KSX_50940 [Ktedonospora formicarum]
MKLAFSKPTSKDEQQELCTRFRSYGYDGLQLKYDQYSKYICAPERFIDDYGTDARDIASGLIIGGRLDEAGVTSLRSVFKFAQAVGTKRIIFCHGESRKGLSSSDLQSFARALSELGKEAQQYEVVLSLHHHYDQPVMYRQDFSVFFEAIVDNTVKLTIDTAHLVKSGIDDIAGMIRDYRHIIDNIHVKDIKKGEFRVLGQGDIDFEPLFTALREIKYDGWLCADEESGSDLVGAMETCIRFLIPYVVCC